MLLCILRHLPVYLGSFGAFGKAFKPPVKKMDELITRIVELAGIARKDGMMALEGQETPDPFFDSGLQMLVDGADEEKLTVQLKKELKGYGNKTREKYWLCSILGGYCSSNGDDRNISWSGCYAW